MKIYTRRGDEGETGLLGGSRVSKADPRVEAYGTIDELNAAIGLALALDREGHLGPESGEGGAAGGGEPAGGEGAAGTGEPSDADRLRRVQSDLFTIGAGLAAARPEREEERGTVPRLPEGRVGDLETWIDRLDGELPGLDAFILPGGCPAGAQLHVARTVCRRAERTAVLLARERPEIGGRVVERVIPYVNRLSDLLFTLARAVNARAGTPEAEWTPRRRGGTGPEASGDGAGAEEAS
ncbi:MAG TPA: cob(I)yrinic acid a,c-diamide adenosyltransferase [Gemmatimonadota bacterium]|nr:cob(I)yrinic acid a,c-diamide adenosyltransferase [Gemmatimonadota bacterium]